MDERRHLLERWLGGYFKKNGDTPEFGLETASSDASFRRYFRVKVEGESYIIMDAPPKQEDCRPFVEISKVLSNAGLNVPRVLGMDLDLGFLLLTDLGEKQYLEVLTRYSVDSLYSDALQALYLMQKIQLPANFLPKYNYELIMSEMMLFGEWFLNSSLELTMTSKDESIIEKTFELLAQEALAQPQVWVHRDYHSRNLMLIDSVSSGDKGAEVAQHNPGILDFQDAVIGPISYDLVSLLRDCYISWPQHQVKAWVTNYYGVLIGSGLISDAVGLGEFQRWFDWMGVQRHLKAIGIFSRLDIRDNKPGYKQDIPRTIKYIFQVCGKYKELYPLNEWLQKNVAPHITEFTKKNVDNL